VFNTLCIYNHDFCFFVQLSRCSYSSFENTRSGVASKQQCNGNFACTFNSTRHARLDTASLVVLRTAKNTSYTETCSLSLSLFLIVKCCVASLKLRSNCLYSQTYNKFQLYNAVETTCPCMTYMRACARCTSFIYTSELHVQNRVLQLFIYLINSARASARTRMSPDVIV